MLAELVSDYSTTTGSTDFLQWPASGGHNQLDQELRNMEQPAYRGLNVNVIIAIHGVQVKFTPSERL